MKLHRYFSKTSSFFQQDFIVLQAKKYHSLGVCEWYVVCVLWNGMGWKSDAGHTAGDVVVLIAIVEILSFAASESSPFDGTMGAGVVASHALHTVFVPLRMLVVGEADIAEGACLDTYTATHTLVVDLEMARIDEETVEEGAHDVALGPWHGARKGVKPASAVYDVVYDLVHAVGHGVEFALLFGLGVYIKSWQAYVGFGHLNSISQLAQPAFACHDVAEYLGSHACIVAAGGDEVEVTDVVDTHLADELLDEWRHAPSVGGEYEAEPLAVLEGVVHVGAQFVGDETEGVAQFVGEELCHPSAVACT